MNLRLLRFAFSSMWTLGALDVDGEFHSFSIEDPDRLAYGFPKIRGRTAIPAGRYRVEMTASARFGRVMPLLVDVPGFTGIRVHAGNTEADTEGCILLGLQATIGSVLKSRKAVESFEAIVRAAKDPVFITIERGGQDAAGFEAVRARLARDAKPPEAIA